MMHANALAVSEVTVVTAKLQRQHVRSFEKD